MTPQPNLPIDLDALPKRTLADATAQEIQLELIRRWQFNDFDGLDMIEKLVEHQSLWQAAFMDRLGVANRDGGLPLAGMIKLRDLPYNQWNIDTLYLPCENTAKANELIQKLEFEDLGGMVTIHTDRQEVDNALGSGRTEQVIVAVWWD